MVLELKAGKHMNHQRVEPLWDVMILEVEEQVLIGSEDREGKL